MDSKKSSVSLADEVILTRFSKQGASKQRIWKYWVRWLGWAGLGAFSNVCLAAFPADFSTTATASDTSTSEISSADELIAFAGLVSSSTWLSLLSQYQDAVSVHDSMPLLVLSNTNHDGSPAWLNGIEIQYYTTSFSNVFFNSVGHSGGRYSVPSSTHSNAVDTSMRFTYGGCDWQFRITKPATSNAITVSAITPFGAAPGYDSNPTSGNTINLSGTLGSTASSTLSISETCNATLSINDISVTGTDHGKFTPSQTSFDIVDGGAAQTVTVTCDGSSAGTFSATLNVAHNAAGSPATYPLSCTINSVSAPGYGSNPASGSPLSITGTVGTNPFTTLSVSETGDATLNVTGITVTGTDAAKFTPSPTTFSIADGGIMVQPVIVTCDGSSAGTFSAAALEVTHNATGSPATYPLSCTISDPSKTNQSISFVPPTTATVGTPFSLSATATSGLSVTFASTTPTVCTVSGTTLTPVSAGTCKVTADQAGDATYNAATQVSKNITVSDGGGSGSGTSYVPPPLPPETTVVVSFGGDGKGKVTSNPSGIDCQTPNACRYTFTTEDTIQLIPTPVGNSRFQNWSEGCGDGVISPSGSTRYCMAYFVDTSIPSYTLTTNVTGEGQGVVVADGIYCGDDCTNDFEKGYQLTVSAEADENSQFLGWQGDCSGTDNVTGLVMDSDKNCSAVFDVIPEEPVVEPEPVTPEPEPVDDTTPPTDDIQTPTPDEPVDEPVVDEEPVTPPVDEEPPVVEEEPEPPVVDEEPEPTPEPPPVVPEPEPTPPVEVLPPVVDDKTCPPKDTLDYYCNAQGQTIGDLNILENPQSTDGVGFLSNAVITGKVVLNRGTWISNITVQSSASVVGGVVTGLNYNFGFMRDFEFRGEFIKGGTLGGFILNTSKIFSWFEDVKLAPNSHLIGGALKGKIKGDPENPALLENLRILSGSVVSGVIIGNGVKIDKDVDIEDSETDDTPSDETELPSVGEDFFAGISINDSSYQNKNVAQILSDMVSMRGRIHVKKNHVGQKANIFVTIAYRLSEDSDEVFQFTVNHTNGLMSWDGKQNTISKNPFRTGEILQTVQTVKIYDGILLATGVVKIQFGYILEDGTVVQSTEGIALTTTE